MLLQFFDDQIVKTAVAGRVFLAIDCSVLGDFLVGLYFWGKDARSTRLGSGYSALPLVVSRIGFSALASPLKFS